MVFRRSPIAAQRARNARMKAQAEAVAAEHYPSAVQPNSCEFPLVMVPANTRETVALPADTREQFLERLAGVIADVFAKPIAPTDVTEASVSDAQGVPVMLGRSCGTCRGECCTAGRDHAFLRAESVARVRAQNPSMSADDLLARYAAHLPERHYRGSCVYHTPSGCNVPRDWRANICNRYICGGLKQLQDALNVTGSTHAVVAAADSVHLRRMALISIERATPISLDGTASVSIKSTPR